MYPLTLFSHRAKALTLHVFFLSLVLLLSMIFPAVANGYLPATLALSHVPNQCMSLDPVKNLACLRAQQPNRTLAGVEISERFAYNKSATKGHLNFMVESKAGKTNATTSTTTTTTTQTTTNVQAMMPQAGNVSQSYKEIFRTAHWIWFSDPTIYSQYKQYIDPYLNWPEASYNQIAQWLGLNLPPGSFDGGRRAVYVDYNPGDFAWTSAGNIGIAYQVFKDVPDWASVVIPHETANMFLGEGVTGGWPTDWWADGRSPFPAMVAVQVEKANNIPYWSAHDAVDSQDPQYVMFRDQLLGKFGWALFQNTFLLMIGSGVNLATIHSEFESPNWYTLHYLKSHTVAYYLSRAAGIDLSTILNQGTVGTPPPGWSAGPFTNYQINLSSVVPQVTLQSPTGPLSGAVTLTSTALDPDWGVHDQTYWWSTDGTNFYYIGNAPAGQSSINWDTTSSIPTKQNQVWIAAVSHDYSGFESAKSVSQPFAVDNTASAPSLTLTTTTPSSQATVTQTVTQQPVTLWATQTVSFTQFVTQPIVTQTVTQSVTSTMTQIQTKAVTNSFTQYFTVYFTQSTTQTYIQSASSTMSQTQTQTQATTQTQFTTQSTLQSTTQSVTPSTAQLIVYLTLYSWNLASVRTVRVDVCTSSTCTSIVASQSEILTRGTSALIAFGLPTGDYYVRVTGSSGATQLQHVTLKSSNTIYFNLF